MTFLESMAPDMYFPVRENMFGTADFENGIDNTPRDRQKRRKVKDVSTDSDVFVPRST